ncbi:MAG: hypothetical protein Q9213_003775 [Squamulea squamosa]
MAIECNTHYAGVHQWDVPQVEVGPFIKRQYFGELAYYLAAFFTKMSILSSIARVFRPHRRAVLFARVFIILMVLYYLPAFFIRALRCRPIRKTWNPIVGGACFGSEKEILYTDCVVSLVTDIAIFGLPVPLVWKLQTSVKRKLRILMVFVSGIAIAEVNIGIICSCLPVLPIFYQHVLKSARALVSKTSSYHELAALRKRSNTSVERVGPGHLEDGNKGVAGCVALHRQYLESKGTAQRTAICASAGTPDYERAEGSWDGVEPGGYVQWDEVDLGAYHAESPKLSICKTASEQLIAHFLEYICSLGFEFGWVRHLGDHFQNHGLEVISGKRFTADSTTRKLETDDHLMVLEDQLPDIATFLARKEGRAFTDVKRDMEKSMAAVVHETEQGASLNMEWYSYVARMADTRD